MNLQSLLKRAGPCLLQPTNQQPRRKLEEKTLQKKVVQGDICTVRPEEKKLSIWEASESWLPSVSISVEIPILNRH